MLQLSIDSHPFQGYCIDSRYDRRDPRERPEVMLTVWYCFQVLITSGVDELQHIDSPTIKPPDQLLHALSLQDTKQDSRRNASRVRTDNLIEQISQFLPCQHRLRWRLTDAKAVVASQTLPASEKGSLSQTGYDWKQKTHGQHYRLCEFSSKT